MKVVLMVCGITSWQVHVYAPIELDLLLLGWRLTWHSVIGPNHKTSGFTSWGFLQTFKTVTIDNR